MIWLLRVNLALIVLCELKVGELASEPLRQKLRAGLREYRPTSP